MRWPWISRESHQRVMDAHQMVISMLQHQVEALEAKLAAPITVTVKLPDNFAVVQPAVVRTSRPRTLPENDNPEPPIEWETLDENDPVVLAQVAARELGRPVTPYVLAQTVNRIRTHIRSAKAARHRHAGEVGETGTMVASAALESLDEEPDMSKVPAHVQRLIEHAEKG